MSTINLFTEDSITQGEEWLFASKWWKFPFSFYEFDPYTWSNPNEYSEKILKKGSTVSITRYLGDRSAELFWAVRNGLTYLGGPFELGKHKELKNAHFKLKSPKVLKRKTTLFAYKVNESDITIKNYDNKHVIIVPNKNIVPVVTNPTFEEILTPFGCTFEFADGANYKKIVMEIKQVIAIITSTLKNPKYKDIAPGFTFGARANDEYNENLEIFCTNQSEELMIGMYDLWKMNSKYKNKDTFKNRSDMASYFWKIIEMFFKEVNVKLKSIGYEINFDGGDWDDGPIDLYKLNNGKESIDISQSSDIIKQSSKSFIDCNSDAVFDTYRSGFVDTVKTHIVFDSIDADHGITVKQKLAIQHLDSLDTATLPLSDLLMRKLTQRGSSVETVDEVIEKKLCTLSQCRISREGICSLLYTFTDGNGFTQDILATLGYNDNKPTVEFFNKGDENFVDIFGKYTEPVVPAKETMTSVFDGYENTNK